MVNPSIHLEGGAMIIKCGEKTIGFRACTGETGENGPFPCITTTEGVHEGTAVIHSEAVFQTVFDAFFDLTR